nr:immunoglobulin light chain junction region [Macaca mulatta]
CRQALDFPWTF